MVFLLVESWKCSVCLIYSVFEISVECVFFVVLWLMNYRSDVISVIRMNMVVSGMI